MQDIHTHLYWESFDTDREAVLARAREAGIQEMIVVGTTIEESRKSLTLAKETAGLFASVGIHPNEFRAGKGAEGWQEALRHLAEDERVIALGECGLDYSQSHGAITENEKSAQREAFVEHLLLAKEVGLPVIIHCRATNSETDDAYQDVYEILKKSSQDIPTILHCYMGSQGVTKKFLRLPNVHFSFTANITYPVKALLRGGEFDFTESVKLIPLERIFSETDCPFLAPQEHRGKRNEPAFVVQVVERLAELQQKPTEEVRQQLETNFSRVFSL